VGGACDKRVPAGAMHADFAVVGVDSCFHVSPESSTQTLDFTGVRKDSARQVAGLRSQVSGKTVA
jgi:hypothetical protein